MACVPKEDGDQPGHLQGLISLCCLHEESLGPQISRLIWVFVGCTRHFVGFVKRWLISNWQNTGAQCEKMYLMKYAPIHDTLPCSSMQSEQSLLGVLDGKEAKCENWSNTQSSMGTSYNIWCRHLNCYMTDQAAHSRIPFLPYVFRQTELSKQCRNR